MLLVNRPFTALQQSKQTGPAHKQLIIYFLNHHIQLGMGIPAELVVFGKSDNLLWPEVTGFFPLFPHTLLNIMQDTFHPALWVRTRNQRDWELSPVSALLEHCSKQSNVEKGQKICRLGSSLSVWQQQQRRGQMKAGWGGRDEEEAMVWAGVDPLSVQKRGGFQLDPELHCNLVNMCVSAAKALGNYGDFLISWRFWEPEKQYRIEEENVLCIKELFCLFWNRPTCVILECSKA